MADIATDEDVARLLRDLRACHVEYIDGQPVGMGAPFNQDGPEAADLIEHLLARLDAKPARPEIVVPIGHVCIPMYAVGSDEERCERLSAVFGDKFTRDIADGILDGDQGVTNDFCDLLLAALSAGEGNIDG